MSKFDEEVAVTRTGEGRYRGHVDPHWNIGDNPNGGYLVSIALAAMADAVDHPDPVSVTAHYLRPGSPGEVADIRVDIIRAGRSLSSVRATLAQQGKSRIEVLAAFSDLSQPAGVDANMTVAPPDLPPPEECIERDGRTQGVELPIASRLDVRLHPDLAEPGNAESPVMSGWIRFRDDRGPDTRSLVLFCDTFPPSPLGVLGQIGWVPTLELTVHCRRRPAPGWIKAQLRTDDLHEGRMIETGALWDSEGKLVAQCRQLGLVVRSD